MLCQDSPAPVHHHPICTMKHPPGRVSMPSQTMTMTVPQKMVMCCWSDITIFYYMLVYCTVFLLYCTICYCIFTNIFLHIYIYIYLLYFQFFFIFYYIIFYYIFPHPLVKVLFLLAPSPSPPPRTWYTLYFRVILKLLALLTPSSVKQNNRLTTTELFTGNLVLTTQRHFYVFVEHL